MDKLTAEQLNDTIVFTRAQVEELFKTIVGIRGMFTKRQHDTWPNNIARVEKAHEMLYYALRENNHATESEKQVFGE